MTEPLEPLLFLDLHEDARERLEKHNSKSLRIELDLGKERDVLVKCFSEKLIEHLREVEQYYNLLNYPVDERQNIRFYINITRGYASFIDAEAAMILQVLGERVDKLCEFLKHRFDSKTEEEILHLLIEDEADENMEEDMYDADIEDCLI